MCLTDGAGFISAQTQVKIALSGRLEFILCLYLLYIRSGIDAFKILSKMQLQGVVDEQLDLYMDRLMQEISRCKAEYYNCSCNVRNEIFTGLSCACCIRSLSGTAGSCGACFMKRRDGLTVGVTDIRRLMHSDNHLCP
jgi:hypothetical protein